MHVRMFRTICVTLVTLAAILSTPWATHAQTPEQPHETTPSPMTAAQQEAYYDAIQRMEQHLITLPDGTFALTVKSGAEIGVDEATFTALHEGMQQTNTMLRSGSLQRSQVQTHTSLEETLSSTTDDVTIDACIGSNGLQWFWWGARIWLDSCNARNLAYGVAPCVVLGFLFMGPAPHPCDLLGGMIGGAVAAGQIVTAEANRTGIWFDVNFVLGVTAVQPQ
ncbi:MAG: hypothetical protein GFH27_549331n10 [Chloroflexi bacterium AL-W]|nr:hypothetical protein [Chloroflexi bacterium AL-N1]NOK70311.1 hypothetical protein [Chloroflexi bacterium AL-N10]NOK77989.1 hypothetical protein [Chloroflexi bacterium AL-N5]NOK85088.1 hypothetical protein [Chloroflexi bacterium AL-W]